MSNYTVSNSDGTADYGSASAVSSALSGTTSGHEAWFLCGDVFNEKMQAKWSGTSGNLASAKAYYLDGGTPTEGVSGEKPHFKGDFLGDWSAGLSVSAGDVLAPTASNKDGFWRQANNSGTAGGSEPSWNAGEGNTTSDNGITWTTYLVPTINDYTGQIEQKDSDYFEFKDLQASNHWSTGLRGDYAPCTEIKITNVDTELCGMEGLRWREDTGSLIIDNLTVKYAGRGSKDSLGQTRVRPAYFSVGRGTSSDTISVKNCVFEQSWQECILGGETQKTFEDNLIYGTWVGVYLIGSQNATVRNFIVLGTNDSYYHRVSNYTGAGILITVETTTKRDNDNNDLYNFLLAGTDALRVGSNSKSTTSYGTLYGFKNTHLSFGDVIDNQVALSFTSSTYTVDVGSSFKNMIFYDYGASKTLVNRSSVANITWANNHWPTDQTGEDWANGNDTSGDPEFATKTGYDTDSLTSSTDIVISDIALGAASEAIGAGVAIAGITTDYSGTAQNSPPDKGAVAYGTPSGDTTPPTDVSGTPTASSVTTTSFDISFTASTDETAMHPTSPYKVYDSGVWLTDVSTNSNASLTGLTPNTTYNITVKGQDSSGNLSTNPSGTLVQATSAPSDTTAPTFSGATSASVDENGKVTISWTQGTDDVTAQGSLIYRVYGGTSTGAFNTTSHIESVVGASSIEFDAHGYGANYYIVRCVDGAGNEDTNTAEVSVDAPKLTATPAIARLRVRNT